MSLLSVEPVQPKAAGPTALDNAAKVLGIITSVGSLGTGIYNASTAADQAGTSVQLAKTAQQNADTNTALLSALGRQPQNNGLQLPQNGQYNLGVNQTLPGQ